MKKYLIDTNIAIYYMKGKYSLDVRFASLLAEQCFISEITLAELKYGIANSTNPSKNKSALDSFLTGVNIFPIFNALDFYAEEKARLRRLGTPIDDFDLLIGATAVSHDLIMVTNNTPHFQRISRILLEDWTTA